MSNPTLGLEHFAPHLRHCERFQLPNGDCGLFRAGHYTCVPKNQAELLVFLDGKRSLTEIIDERNGQGKMTSIRGLLQLTRLLAESELLENSRDELVGHGLPFQRPQKSPLKQLLLPSLGLSSLGALSSSLLRPLSNIVPTSRTAVVLSCLMIATGFVALAFLPNPFPQDALAFEGSHAMGLVLVYAGLACVLTGRELLRALTVLAGGGALEHAGLALHVGVLAPFVDVRHNFRTGKPGALRLGLNGLLGAVASFCIMVGVAHVFSSQPQAAHALGLLLLGGFVALLALLCPFLPTDLGRTIDLVLPTGAGRNHALTYFRTQLLKSQGNTPFFEGELHHVMVTVASVLWIYAVYTLAAQWLMRELPMAALTLATSDSWTEKFAVTALVALLVLAFVVAGLLVLVGALRFVWSHLPQRQSRGRPLGEYKAAAAQSLSKSPLFGHLTGDQLHKLGECAQALEFKTGQTVVRQGEEGQRFFLIAEGRADVRIKQASGVEQSVATLFDGDGFGEIALLENKPRTATVTALERLIVYAIGRSDFLKALEQSGVDRMHATALLRGAHAIRQTPVFQHLNPSSVTKLVESCVREEFKGNDTIIREGEMGEKFYLIESGEVSILKEGVPQPVAKLSAGACFGEMALLNDAPRTATVQSLGNTVLLSLNRAMFRDVLSHDFQAGLRLEGLAQERAHGTS